ncbi:MAG: hypothetical protein KJ058_13520 [Thermoanaerobaculia bacterium]|nr:hypothetical protein [Thermoanaerobaculia bacterium]
MKPDSEDPRRELVDARLRAALEPSAAEVERAVRGALAGPRRAPLRRWAPALVGAVLLALAGATLLGPLFRRPEPAAPHAGLSIVSVGSVVLARNPGRESWITNTATATRANAGSPSLLIVWKEDAP